MAAMLTNLDDLTAAYEDAMNAEGSAMSENEKYLDSIQGRIDQFTNALQTMWMNVLNDDVIKFIVSLGTGLIKIVDTLGLVPSLITAIGAAIAAQKSNTFGEFFTGSFGDLQAGKWGDKIKTQFDKLFPNIDVEVPITPKVDQGAADAMEAIGDAAEESSGKVIQFSDHLKTQGATANNAVSQNQANAASEKAVGTAATTASFGVKLLNTALSMGISLLAGIVINLIFKAIDNAIHKAENLKNEVTDLTKEYKNAQKELSSNLDKLSTSSDTEVYATLNDEFSRLASGVDKYGKNISLTSAQYARYQEICQIIAGIQPSLVEGYDNATEAIGNNASALSQLIELQKEEARQKAAELVDDKNMKKIAKNAINEYEDAREQISRYMNSNGAGGITGISNLLFQIFDWNEKGTKDYGDRTNKDDLAKKIMETIGIEEIDKELEKYYNSNGSFQYDDWIRDYIDIIANNKLKIADALEDDTDKNALLSWADSYKIAQSELESASDGVISTLLQVPKSLEEYSQLSQASQSAITEWIRNSDLFKIDADTTEAEILAMRDMIKTMVRGIANGDYVTEIDGKKITAQDILNRIIEIDPSKVNWAEYQSRMQELIEYLWQAIGADSNSFGFEDKYQMAVGLGINFISDEDDTKNQLISDIQRILDISADDAQKWVNSLPAQTVTAMMQVDWSAYGTGSLDQQGMLDIAAPKVTAFIESAGKAYSSYASSVEKFTNAASIANEILYDNIELTQEQGEALKALIGQEEKYSDAIDDTNGYIVKNARLAKDLIAKKRLEAAQNAKVEKTQARLQYYDLYKQIHQLSQADGELSAKNKDQINILYDEMQTVAQTIQKYAALERQLLGVANAYTEFSNAKEIDDANTYDSELSEMVQYLANAFNTGELGTAQAQAAIKGLIPQDVIDKAGTLDERMQNIYDYFTGGPLSKYITVEFDEEGTMTSAEMTLDNVKQFVEDGIAGVNGVQVFTGSWDSFDLAPEIKSLSDLADAYGITEDAAFAFLQKMEDYDISWLGGDFTTLMDQLMGDDLEYNLQKNIGIISEYEQKLANGTATMADTAKYKEASAALEENTQKARDNAKAYSDAATQYNQAKEDAEAAQKAIAEAGEGVDTSDLQKQLDTAIEKMQKYGQIMSENEITELIVQVAMDAVDVDIGKIEQQYSNIKEQVTQGDDGTWVVNTEFKGELSPELENYLSLLNEKHSLEVLQGDDVPTVLSVLEEIRDILNGNLDLNIETDQAKEAVNQFLNWFNGLSLTKEVKVNLEKVYGGGFSIGSGDSELNGTAHASGNFGLQQAEHNSLVGELGMETVVDPQTGRYYTVGDNGAELVDLPKNAIIFNHKQTEELFKNGHINSRGKAYAQGNAHVDLVKKATYGVNTWTKKVNTVSSDWGKSSAASSAQAAAAAEEAAKDVSEIFDWFEVLLEEINEQLDLMNAKLENAVGIEAKSSILGELLSGNHYKLTELNEGLKLYTDYAAKMLSKVPDEYKEMAKNGAVAITDFLGEANEETVEAINNYREWAKKVADLNQQLEETRTTISDLRVQSLDMIRTEYENEIGLITTINDQIQSTIDLLEEKGQRSSSNFYTEMIANSEEQLNKLKEQRAAMQKELDDAVASGDVQKYSEDWYEMLNSIYDVDSAIIDCKTNIEKFDNAILELHWDNFEKIIDALDAISDEAEQVRSIIDDSDIVDDVGNWTKNGLTALGMAAQEMEKARYRADLYGKEIEQLNKDFSAGKYSQDEYNEKLKELKDAQWDSIEAYESAKDTLVDLNKTRVEAVKDGLQKEIDAYEKLIDKRKEDLDAQKDAHDWANTLKDRTDEIDKIQRQIDAMAGDTSAAANAQRKKLQEELANAQKELDETYYDRDIEMQQKALDDSLESYRQNKEDRMQELEDYLENEDQVVSDSYALILANTDAIASNLQEIAQRYGISISENVTAPWESGMTALGTYGEELDYATSSYVDMLEKVRKELIDLQIEADKTAAKLVKDINTSANQSQNANKAPAPSQSSTPAKSAPSLTTGSQVVVKPSATTFARDGGNGTRMQSWVPGGTFTVYQVSGDQVLIGLPGKGYTGWVRKQDIVGYAKGTTGVKKDQFAVIDENGLEELIMHADGGKLSYLTKGTAVVPNDLTNNIMKWGEIDPVAMLDRNKPSIGAPHIIENQMQIDMSIAEVVHIEHADRDSIPEIQDAVKKQLDSYMKNLNSGIKKYTR